MPRRNGEPATAPVSWLRKMPSAGTTSQAIRAAKISVAQSVCHRPFFSCAVNGSIRCESSSFTSAGVPLYSPSDGSTILILIRLPIAVIRNVLAIMKYQLALTSTS